LERKENTVKNCIDMPIISQSEQSSLWLFVPRTSQISLYPTRETAFADFSCGSSKKRSRNGGYYEYFIY